MLSAYVDYFGSRLNGAEHDDVGGADVNKLGFILSCAKWTVRFCHSFEEGSYIGDRVKFVHRVILLKRNAIDGSLHVVFWSKQLTRERRHVCPNHYIG
jgi:hypothetical protein